MARDSIRSVRRGAVAVAFLGLLSLAVPVALLADDERAHGGPRLAYADQRAAGYEAGRQQPAATIADSRARVIDVVVPGFAAYESVLLQLSDSGATFDHGQADGRGVVHYRFTVPPLAGGTHVLSVVGSRPAARSDVAATPAGHHFASYAFTVPG